LTGRWSSRQCPLVVIVALAVRLAVVCVRLPERLNPDQDHWRFAGETGRIAKSIAEARGFSSPLPRAHRAHGLDDAAVPASSRWSIQDFGRLHPGVGLGDAFIRQSVLGTDAEDYYRRPIDPIFVVMAAYAITQWQELRRQAEFEPEEVSAQEEEVAAL